MKCSVCGSESKPDARFCANCGATLKSAAEAAPPDDSPPGGPGGTVPAPGSAPPRTRMGGLALLVVALGVVGYFVYRVMTPDVAAPPTAASAPSKEAAKAAVAPPPAPVPEPAKTESVALPAVPPSPEPAKPETAAPESAPAPSPEPPKTVSTATPSKAPSASAKAPAPPRVATKTASKAQPAPGPASGPVAAPTPAPAPAPAPPRPDRWQLMSEAMARCARENIINRVVCEQKVGREYCDGYWGKVPQCSSGRPSEFGR